MVDFRFTMSVIEFRRALSNVSLFTGTDKDQIPVVQFQVTDDTLAMVATDLYMLGTETHIPQSCEGEGAIALHRRDAQGLLKALPKRSPVGPTDAVYVTVENSLMTVEHPMGGMSMTFHGNDRELPNWRKLMPERATGESVEGVAITQKALATLGKVEGSERNRPMGFGFQAPGRHGDPRPVRVEIGETFVGILQPVRQDAPWWEASGGTVAQAA